MIPEKNANRITSTVEGDAIGMTIEEAAMGHIMNVLTNLYSDEELAVLREYATNAFDSHVEAGQSRPIEVTLPTDLRPILSIRDFGVGLSAEEIETIYSRYGASTKRGSNDAVGMLGLGCKSALAYVDQFTLVGIKDGERITVSVARDEHGAGVMTILSVEETDELSGVEVLIPTKRHHLFEIKAEEFFKWWDPGTVLVNGVEPAPVEPIWQIDDEFTIVKKDSYERKLRVVMGNVSYPVSYEYEHESAVLRRLPDDKQIVARVPIGMVSFTPSREALQEHPATKAALDQILATFEAAAEGAIKSQVAEAQDKPAAAKALIAARDALGPKNVPAVTFEGAMVPTVISAEDLQPAGSALWKNNPQSYGASRRSPAGQVSLDDAARFPWIVNYTNTSWSKTQRRKLNRYLTEHKLLPPEAEANRQTILITNAPSVPLPEWIDGNVLAIDWSDVREWKDPLTKSEGGSSAGKYAGTYEVYFYSDERARQLCRSKYAADALPKSGRNLYYCTYGGGSYQKALGLKSIVAEVPDHRLAKFRRLFPHAREARAVMEAAAARWWARLGADAALAIAIGEHTESLSEFEGIPPEDIVDPKLSEALEALRRWNEDVTLQNTYSKFSSYLANGDEVRDVVLECEKIVAQYPLINRLWNIASVEQERHLVIYINAAYAAETR